MVNCATYTFVSKVFHANDSSIPRHHSLRTKFSFIPFFFTLQHTTYLVASVRNDGDALLRDRHMLDMSEVFGARLLNAGQKQKTVAVRREHRMRQNVQPFVFGRPLRVRLIVT